MSSIKLRAPGKINWTLDVISRRKDGYHEVEMLMQSISLWDDIKITECNEGIQITGNLADMPLDESNLAAKAARLIMDSFGITTGVCIDINKRIPAAAGLAGGSTNAAAVLVGLNEMWNLGLSPARLAELGTALGADVPFCILGGTAIARGIGEKLTHLPALEGIPLILVKPPFGVSTAEVYKGLVLENINFHPDSEKVYNLLASGNLQLLKNYSGNILENVTARLFPEINDIKADLYKAGAAFSMMTGSGSTVFGVFEREADARKAVEKLRANYSQVFYAASYGRGVEITEGGSL